MNRASAIAEIDDVIGQFEEVRKKYRKVSRDGEEYADPPGPIKAEITTLMANTFKRLAPGGLCYLGPTVGADRESITGYTSYMCGALKALRQEYEKDWLRTFQELVASDIFSDFLEQAEYLLAEGYKVPAAVVGGSVLEEHLRKLCDKNSVARTTAEPRTGKDVPHKLDRMNADLAKATAYGKNDQKMITGWADIRNDAAHGYPDKFNDEQVKLMLMGIRDFLNRNPG